MIKKGLRLLILAGFVAAILNFSGCGGSSVSAPPVSIPTPVTGRMTVTGTVNSPSSSNLNLSAKANLAKAVTDAPVEGLTGTLYNLDGVEIGTCTTDSAGTCSIEGDIDDIKPAGATGTEWTAKLILVATNDDGSIHIETYVETTVSEGTTTTIALGTADSESTLAAGALKRKGGCSAWGEDCTALFAEMDSYCYFKAQEQIWTDSDRNGNGLADDSGKMKDLIRGAMAAGIAPSDYGYDDWGGIIADAIAGLLDSSVLNNLASLAGSAIGVDASIFTDGYSDAAQAFDSLDTIVGSQLAGGAGLTALASMSKAATTSEGSACDNIKDATVGSDYTDGLIGTFMACSTPTECTNIYSDADCFKISIGLMEEYKGAGDFEKIKEAGAAFQGYMSGMAGETAQCDGFFDPDGTFDDSDFDGLYQVFNRFDTEDQHDFEAMKEWGYSWEGTIQHADGGFENFLGEGGTYDPDKFEYYSEYFDGQVGGEDYCPESIDWESFEGEIKYEWDHMGDSGSEFEECMLAGGTCETCGGCPTLPLQ